MRPGGRFSPADERYMRMALGLAEKARGATRPNPLVGAVVVRGGRVIGRGWHRKAGNPHAEIEALAQTRMRAPGSTLYVTLEPCCHTGRTGPCASSIIAAGVRRVVVGCQDANPLVDGKGIARLRRAGVSVDVGCLEPECRALNRGFFRWIRDGRPWVTLKVAATLDGVIAPARGRAGEIQWVTGSAARRVAHELRAANDAVLVGAGTVLSDDPRLTVRLPGRRARPLRVVLDGALRTPRSARLLRGAERPLVIGGQAPRAARTRARALERAGAEVLLLPSDRRGRVTVPRVLRALAARGVQSLLVEGGSAVHGAFVAARAVDEVAFFLAPRLAGSGKPIVDGPGLPWAEPLRLETPRVRAIGDDLLITAQVREEAG